MTNDRQIRCPGCDKIIQALATICKECMRCPSCGSRRREADPPCACGHPHDAEQLARLIRKFGVSQ